MDLDTQSVESRCEPQNTHQVRAYSIAHSYVDNVLAI